MNLLFVRHLTVIDFSFLHPQRGLVGESWIVDVELEGDLNDQGMVFDFGHVKQVIKSGIDQFIDHKLVVPSLLPGLIVEEQDGQVQLQLQLPQGEIRHSSPAQALALLDITEVLPEQIAPVVASYLKGLLPDNVRQVHLKLRPEVIDGAYYQYSHGLKKHDGNCQRIAHGHRSRIEILKDGVRCPELEQQWADAWRDIYIASQEDQTALVSVDGVDHLEFRYQANQGPFYLRLPREQVYLIDTDSTVEWVAQHIAQALKQQAPDSQIQVRAYEGVDKGSIAIA